MGDRSGGQDMLRREYDRINAKWLNAHFRAGAGLAGEGRSRNTVWPFWTWTISVSYTHLTLPTIA